MKFSLFPLPPVPLSQGANAIPSELVVFKSFLILVSTTIVAAEEVCYDDLGCFSNDAPYDVFFNFPPKTPDEINTEFLLYTRLNPSLYMKVSRMDIIIIIVSKSYKYSARIPNKVLKALSMYKLSER